LLGPAGKQGVWRLPPITASVRSLPDHSVAYAVVVPRDVVDRKRRALERLGAEVVLADGDYGVAERQGRALAAATGALFVSPYNDPDVVAGQGTLGLELAGQLSTVGKAERVEVFVPVSGGGLLAGVGLGLRLGGATVRLIGVQTEAAPYFHRFFNGGDPSSVVETPTIADGLAGAVEVGSITLSGSASRRLVVASEDEIAPALREIAHTAGMVVEPPAAVAVAGIDRGRVTARSPFSAGKRVAGLLGRAR
jgi:threonine dehydratase